MRDMGSLFEITYYYYVSQVPMIDKYIAPHSDTHASIFNADQSFHIRRPSIIMYSIRV